MSTSSPYPGLRPFHRDETDIFFGREEQIDQLLEKLSQSRFLAVVGPSGCGKSSLVRAGMFASLEAGFMVSAGAYWRMAEMRPGSHPLKPLAVTLLDVLRNERRGEDALPFLQATLRRGPLGLVEVLRETPLPEQTNLLLLIDQFEEIFRFRKERDIDEADAFVSLLTKSASQREFPIYVVITMRSDFLGDCAVFAELPELINECQFLTPRLTREQCRSAIVGPARVFGGDVDAELVNNLLNDMGRDPDQLPLMQHLMMRMWTQEQIESHGDNDSTKIRLTYSNYEAAGGLTKALSNHADEAYEQLNKEQQRIAEVLFRCLSERSSDKRDTRRPTAIEVIASVAGVSTKDVAKVIEVFRHPNCNFLTPPQTERLYPNTIIDISHESLIRQWERMNIWVDQEAKSAENYRLLEQTALLWKDEKAALWGTPDLENALEWKKREKPTAKWAERYGKYFKLAMNFLDVSEKEHKKKEKEEERQRQHELQQARLLAEDQKKRAEAEVKTALRFRRLSIAISIAILLALGASVTASIGFFIAKKNQRISFSRILAWAAKSNLNVDPERGLLLALHAASLEQSPMTEEILQRAVATSRIRLTIFGHTDQSLGVAYSPDGQRIATCSDDNTAIVWDANTGGVLDTLSGHTGSVRDVAFSPDGKRIATCSDDNTARVWDANTGELLHVLTGHTSSVRGVAFSPDGKRIATCGDDDTAKVWDAKTGKESLSLSGHDNVVSCVAFHPDGTRIATASWDNTARIWDANTGGVIDTLSGHGDWVRGVAFSSDGERIATCSDDNFAGIWDANTGEVLYALSGHTDWVRGVAYSPDGQRIATCSNDNTTRIWDANTGEELFTISGHTDRVSGIAFNPDGKHLASASGDGTVKVWRISAGEEELRTLSGHTGSVRRVAFSPDGERIAACGDDSTSRVWDAKTGEELLTLSGHTGRVRGVAFSPDGERIATCSDDSTARIWDANTGGVLETLSGHTDWVRGVAFSPDGERIATCSDDSTARIWDANTGGVETLSGHNDWVRGVVFSPDGECIATCSDDNTARIWDANTGGVLDTLSGHTGSVRGVAFSPDGQRIATCSDDNTARIWDANTGGLLDTLSGHTGSVRGVAFSPDGTHLVTSSMDGTAKVWDTESSDKSYIIYSGPRASFSGVAFNPDSLSIAIANSDGTVKLFVRKFEDLMALARERVTRSLTLREVEEYLGLEFHKYLRQEKWPLTATGLIFEGKNQAAAGDVESAILIFQRALELEPSLDLDPEVEAGRLVASGLVSEGRELAYNGDVDSAIMIFRRALKLDPSLDLDPEVEAERLAAPGLVSKGEDIAYGGNVDSAIVIFRRALKLDPSLDFDPEVKAERLAAPGLVSKGQDLAQDGKIEEAITAYSDAQELDPTLEISADSWNILCWFGSLHGAPADVLFAGERAVEAEPDNGNYRDTRGLARALLGDYQQAIEDFNFFIDWADDYDDYFPYLQSRKDWIAKLEAGQNPFDKETLEAQLNE